MSRAPVSAEKPHLGWLPADRDYPIGVVVLTTNDPADPAGTPALFYTRRSFKKGRWHTSGSWVDPLSRISLMPQPSFWRPDKTRTLFPLPFEPDAA